MNLGGSGGAHHPAEKAGRQVDCIMRRARGSMQDLGVVKGNDHKWLLQVTIPSTDGIQHRKTKRYTGTSRDADRLLVRMVEDADTKGRLDNISMTAFFNKRFLGHCEEKGLSPTTIAGYRRDYNNHVDSVLGNKTMAEISPSDISALLKSLSVGSARHVKALLSSMFSYAEETEVVSNSVMRRRYTLPATTVRKNDDSVHDLETLNQIAEACRWERWEWAFLAMAFAGLRRSEASALQPWDFTFEIVDGQLWCSIRVTRTMVVVDGQIIVKEDMKTEASRRDALMAPPHSHRMQELQHIALDNGWVWMAGERPYNPDSMSCAYDRWHLTHPFRRIPMRNLRNSYATWMVTSGVDLGVVGKLMGHTELPTTYRHYLRPSVQDAIRLVSNAQSDATDTGETMLNDAKQSEIPDSDSHEGDYIEAENEFERGSNAI